MNITLSPEQIVTLSLIASVLVIVLRFIYEIAKKKSLVVPDWVMLVLVYVVSLLVGILWFPQALPPLPMIPPEPLAAVGAVLGFIGSVLAMLTVYATVAALIYDILLKKVKDGLGQLLLPRLYGK